MMTFSGQNGNHLIVLILSFVLLPVMAADIDLELTMPGALFGPGSACYLDLNLVNSGPAINNVQVFVALTVGTGDYWFYPGWVQFPPDIDWEGADIGAGDSNTLNIIPSFLWPSGAGAFSGAMFLAAVVDGGFLVSNIADYTFGWTESPPSTNLLQPEHLTYLGAFRLPGGETPPLTFAYGGNAMTFNSDGNPAGTGDILPGSLFVMGHDRQAWGQLPNGNQVAEISIPAPVMATHPDELPMAEFIQGFHEVLAGRFNGLDEIPRAGMAYYSHELTGAKIHIGWGQHMPPQEIVPTHGWFSPTLAEPDFAGEWYIGNQNFNSVNGYMFTIPSAWSNAHTDGRPIATGRFRDGGWSGMGPALFAYRPWTDTGCPSLNGTHLSETTLLLYQDTYTSNEIVRCMTGYQHPDEWEGGAWVSTPSGHTAVLFSGTKSTGSKYWYGYINPAGPEHPCVDDNVTDMITCRLADGTPCPPEDFAGCCDESLGDCVSLRGWWSSRFDSRIIFYDPAHLAMVASGAIESHEPQPYAFLDLDDTLFLNPSGIETETIGWGPQRRYRIGDMAYDAANGLIYIIERFADGAKPVVHVWEVSAGI
jgi:hypothetical protein